MLFLFSNAPMGNLEFSIIGLIFMLIISAVLIVAILVVFFIVIGGLLVLYYDIHEWLKKRRAAKNPE